MVQLELLLHLFIFLSGWTSLEKKYYVSDNISNRRDILNSRMLAPDVEQSMFIKAACNYDFVYTALAVALHDVIFMTAIY